MGRWTAQMIGMAAELGLADQIQTGPKTVEELAVAAGLHAPSLYRLLRALANFQIFAEQEDGCFVQTPMSDALRSDVPYSIRSFARFDNRSWVIRSWMQIGHSLRTGASAFEQAYGMPVFEYLSQNPEEMRIFKDARRGFTLEAAAAVAKAYDFSSIRTLADIGGGQGLVLSFALAKYPTLRGILFELPNVVKGASGFLRSRGLENRVEVRGGSFFDAVPSGADAYLFTHILHAWSDADCLRILKNVHAATKPGAKMLIVEAVVEISQQSRLATSLDIQRLLMTHGGKERTRIEWQKLLGAGGFRLSRVVPTASYASVIEAVPQ